MDTFNFISVQEVFQDRQQRNGFFYAKDVGSAESVAYMGEVRKSHNFVTYVQVTFVCYV
jgi:hypothetical protein